MTHRDIKQIFINFDYRELIELPKMIKMGYIQSNIDQKDVDGGGSQSQSRSISLDKTSSDKSSKVNDFRQIELEGG